MKNEEDHFLVVQEDIQNKKVWKEKRSNGSFKETPFEEMTPSQIQTAYNKSCSKQLFYHNKTMMFDKLVGDLEDEAESRGITLKDYDSNFHQNRRKFKNSLKKRENVKK